MLAREKGESRWVKCPYCGHKLFKAVSVNPMLTREHVGDLAEGDIEIKCHSCKGIVAVSGGVK